MIDRNIFIVNPAAGQGEGNEKFISTIKETAARLEMEVEIHKTLGVGEATHYVNRIATESDENIRFFACGGDGTLNEVINGAAGHPNAIVGCIPIGTGNDFVRNFPDAGDFMSVEAQLLGTEKPIDILEYEGRLEDEIVSGFAVNMLNIGFDSNVVDMAAHLKKYPAISGSFAYLLGVAIILIKKKGANLKIELDGETIHNGPLLLTTIANGCFCGGGVMSNPLASLDDGHFDAEIIKNVSRLKFITLFPKYSKGTHLELKGVDQIISYREAHNMHVTALGEPFRVSIDGEIISLDQISVGLDEQALRFSIPH